MEIEGYKIHPLAQKVPEMTVGEYRQLKESLQQTGQASPIINYQGEIADGRHRLKACLELGLTPWIKEYDGDKPIAQYILSTNIRRNLTKEQRQQLLADFAKEIIPQVEAEMKERQKSKPGRTSFVRKDPSGRNDDKDIHPGRRAFMDATGATACEAQQIKAIHDKAPELLAEVAQRGGLAPTEKEARRRASKPAKKDKEPQLTYSERVSKLPGAGEPIKFLTPEEFDPDFKGSKMDFVSKNGFVLLETKQEREKAKALSQMSFWIGELRKLKTPLLKFLEQCPIAQGQVDQWIEKFGPEKAQGRRAEVTELIGLLGQAAGCIKT